MNKGGKAGAGLPALPYWLRAVSLQAGLLTARALCPRAHRGMNKTLPTRCLLHAPGMAKS